MLRQLFAGRRKAIEWLCMVPIAYCLIYLVFKESTVPSPPDWPDDFARQTNLFERMKVVDRDSGKTIFWYSPENSIRPVKLERRNSEEWVITFRKTRN